MQSWEIAETHRPASSRQLWNFTCKMKISQFRPEQYLTDWHQENKYRLCGNCVLEANCQTSPVVASRSLENLEIPCRGLAQQEKEKVPSRPKTDNPCEGKVYMGENKATKKGEHLLLNKDLVSVPQINLALWKAGQQPKAPSKPC